MDESNNAGCFLCEKGKCFLRLINFGGFICNVYSSLFPDLDEKAEKPLHLLISPEKHFESIFEMNFDEYTYFMLVARRVQAFYLNRGYGPAVTTLMLHPGPHTPHLHFHLIFSSDPLRPLNKDRKKIPVNDSFLKHLKEELKPCFSEGEAAK